jgi:hypothetical protein
MLFLLCVQSVSPDHSACRSRQLEENLQRPLIDDNNSSIIQRRIEYASGFQLSNGMNQCQFLFIVSDKSSRGTFLSLHTVKLNGYNSDTLRWDII